MFVTVSHHLMISIMHCTSNMTLRNLRQLVRNVSKMTSISCTKPFTILVEGNLGCGKTTFLQHFQHNENVQTEAEPVNKWRDVRGHNLFELLYSDPSKWGFMFQTFVQLSMRKVHGQKTDKPVKIMERSLYSARYVFVENLVKGNLISPQQEVVLDEWFQYLTQDQETSCDLIVYLRTNPEIAYERMKTRGRPEEVSVPMDYIQRIHQFHENWLTHKTAFSLPCPVLTLDANKSLKDMEAEYDNCEKFLSASARF